MSLETNYKCDGCKEKCKYFFQFNDVLVQRANGKEKYKPMGYQELRIKDKTFCSIFCLEYWLDNFADPTSHGWKGDYFTPGEQRTVEDCNGKLCGK